MFANSINPDDRPKKLFLVLEQLLTRTYHITHQQGSSQECEIEFSAGIKLPSVGDASAFANCHVEKAQAGFGFEVVSKTSDVQYAIFLDVCWLFPAKSITLDPRKAARVREQSQYFLPILLAYCGDVWRKWKKSLANRPTKPNRRVRLQQRRIANLEVRPS